MKQIVVVILVYSAVVARRSVIIDDEVVILHSPYGNIILVENVFGAFAVILLDNELTLSEVYCGGSPGNIGDLGRGDIVRKLATHVVESIWCCTYASTSPGYLKYLCR